MGLTVKALTGKFASRKKDGEAPDSGNSESGRVLRNGQNSAGGPAVGGHPEPVVSLVPQGSGVAPVGEAQPVPHVLAPLGAHPSATSGLSSNGSLTGSQQWVPSDTPALPGPVRPSHAAAGPLLDPASGRRISGIGSSLSSGTHDTGTPGATVSPAMSLDTAGLADAQPPSSGPGVSGQDATSEPDDNRLFSWMPVSAFHRSPVSAFFAPSSTDTFFSNTTSKNCNTVILVIFN